MSADMNISFLGSAKVGDVVETEAVAEKVGGSLAFVTVKISRVKEGGEGRSVVTLGRHTKYVQQARTAVGSGTGTPRG